MPSIVQGTRVVGDVPLRHLFGNYFARGELDSLLLSARLPRGLCAAGVPHGQALRAVSETPQIHGMVVEGKLTIDS